MEKLIRQIVKEAEVKIPLTTLVKGLDLDPEQGSVEVSLDNLEKILKSSMKFEVNKITFYLNKNNPRLHTEWSNKDDVVLVWDFRGFDAGPEAYDDSKDVVGEKAKGLEKALKSLGRNNWRIEEITQMKPGTYKIL